MAELQSTDGNNAVETHTRLRLVFLRHGESVANQLGLLAGQEDFPLTDQGRSQAQALGMAAGSTWLRVEGNESGEPPENGIVWGVYCSDLVRAKETLKLATEGVPQQQHLDGSSLFSKMVLDERLRERSYGARQGMDKKLSEEQALTIRLSHGIDPPMYETDEDLWKRGSEWLLDTIEEWKRQTQLAARTDSPGAAYYVIVSSHAGLIRATLQHLFDKTTLMANGARYDASRNDRLIIPNTSVTVIDIMDPLAASPLDTATLVELTNTKHLETAYTS